MKGPNDGPEVTFGESLRESALGPGLQGQPMTRRKPVCRPGASADVDRLEEVAVVSASTSGTFGDWCRTALPSVEWGHLLVRPLTIDAWVDEHRHGTEPA